MLSRFRRITSGTRYLPEIDGIRFVAIASVFLFHLAGDILRHSPEGYRESIQSGWVFWATQRMNFGVQLFFVLSGLVLALPFASFYLEGERAVSLKRYFLRRFTRLEPPYVVALILFFFLKLAAGRASIPWLGRHLAASLAYVHNLIYSAPSDINFVSWSLEIEVQFYLCAPILASLFYRIRGDLVRRLILAASCLAAAVPAMLPSTRIPLSLIGQFPYFLAGMLLADLVSKGFTGDEPNRPRSILWDVAVLLTVPFLLVAHRSQSTLLLAGPLTVCFAYYAALHSRWTLSLLRLPFVSTVGGMCYSIYLVHNYIIAVAGTSTEKLSSSLPFTSRLVVQSLVLGPVVLLFSGLFFLLIERPCMRPDWPQRLRARFAKVLPNPRTLPRVERADEILSQ